MSVHRQFFHACLFQQVAQYLAAAIVSAIDDGIRWAEQIMAEIDRRHPTQPAQQQTAR